MAENQLFTSNKTMRELIFLDHEINDLGGSAGLLHWDMSVMMPPRGIELRAQQLSTLSGLIHDRITNPKIGEIIAKLETELKDNPENFTVYERSYVREWRRAYDLAVKIPKRLVIELTEATAIGQKTWERAKEENSFALFVAPLTKIYELTREKANCLGYSESPYDPLLDEYETGSSEKWINSLFVPLRTGIMELRKKIAGSAIHPTQSILQGEFPTETQEHLGKQLMEWFGFDFNAGRIDTSVHPFSINFGGPQDVRITTRVKTDDISYSLLSTIHETGHAVYEQQGNPLFSRTMLGGGVSLGIHESQSRMFENIIGRSKHFWTYWYPRMQMLFPTQLPETGANEFYRALNIVQPSLIRTGADEVTYNLHIIMRFELESALIRKTIAVKDLPEIWNAKMKDYFGLVPNTDTEGVLQDVHWSGGMIGYFPTYALGNLYAAQIMHTMKKTLDVDSLLEQGNFTTIREWLKENIHVWGQTYTPQQLMQRITGEDLNPKYFLDYLNNKYSTLYEFN